MSSSYRAIAHREGDWWVVEVPGVGVTQARRLEQVDHMARDMVAIMEDVAYDDVQVNVEVHVTDELDRLREENLRLAREAAALAERARVGKERLMRQLRKQKLSARDIGKLTGVSHQRVSQVIGATTERKAKVRRVVERSRTRAEAITAVKAESGAGTRKAKVQPRIKAQAAAQGVADDRHGA